MFKKKFGQNFINDKFIINNITSSINPTEDDLILEIGPGSGALTKNLVKYNSNLICYEVDKDLENTLNQIKNDKTQIIFDDFLKRDIQSDISKIDYNNLYIIGNLPYYITTPIVMKFLEEDIPVTDIVVMVQKEVADRMNAKPNTKDYGALSVAVQYYCDTEIVAKAPRHMFVPQPNVDSIVIGLHVRDEKKYIVDNEDIFFKTVKASFGQRRKTLLNSLGGLGFLSKDQIKEALKAANIDEKRRGETLSIDEFANLSNEINKFSSK